MAPRKAYINVDLGEGYGNYGCGPDELLIPMIDHANVACGFHAGDPLHMQQAVRQCKERGIKIGAHPGLPDVQGFGRREMKLSPEEHTANIIYQVGALRGFLDAGGVELHHVKPHGILYGMMCRDAEVCRAVYAGVPRGVKVFGLAGTCQETVAAEMGLEFVAEFYGDVKYDDEGRLVIDRVKKPWKVEDVKRHVRQQLEDSAVTSSVSGKVVPLPTKDYAISVCCHSDSPGCVDIVTATREVVDEYNKANGF
ncbi:lactam utilization protein lamB [Apiospora marii]|uniref:lactam utilization protein lamB n=1 Tax=Apiospora marii TaxID=335849 RepID=UPI0031305CCF